MRDKILLDIIASQYTYPGTPTGTITPTTDHAYPYPTHVPSLGLSPPRLDTPPRVVSEQVRGKIPKVLVSSLHDKGELQEPQKDIELETRSSTPENPLSEEPGWPLATPTIRSPIEIKVK
jgi:hypothetical protein